MGLRGLHSKGIQENQMAIQPAWVEQARLKRARNIQRDQDLSPRLSWNVADSFHTAPGYRQLGVEYSCILDSLYPPEREVMQAVKRIAPDLEYMWVRWILLSPSNTGNPKVEVYGRHALGRIVSDPHNTLPFLPVTLPHGMSTRRRPNKVHRIFQNMHDKGVTGLGGYLPFDWNVYYWIAETYKEATAKELFQVYAQEPEDASQVRKASIQSHMDYIQEDIGKWIQKKLDDVSELEVKEHFLSDN